MKIIEQWNDGASAEGFVKFAVRALQTPAIGFTDKQAEILAKIIEAFVDEADKWQKDCMDAPSSSLGRARAKLDELFRDIPEDDSLVAQFKRRLFGDVRSFSEKIRKFLPKEEFPEVDNLFPVDADGASPSDGGGCDDAADGGGCDDAADVVDFATAEQMVDLGVFADELEKSLAALAEEEKTDGSSQNPTQTETVPACVRAGLETDLLSPEETLFKKLVALELLVETCTDVENAIDADRAKANAPLVAIGAARGAFKFVEEQKTRFRWVRLRALRAMVSAVKDEGGSSK